jgi:hypothetical protein
MSIVEKLIEAAMADTDLLRTLDSQGDDFSVPREVDFLLRTPSKDKADLVAGFINDYQYGAAVAEEHDGDHSVSVRIVMPIEQNILLPVSGFMECLAQLFKLEYDGWGCHAQKR